MFFPEPKYSLAQKNLGEDIDKIIRDTMLEKHYNREKKRKEKEDEIKHILRNDYFNDLERKERKKELQTDVEESNQVYKVKTEIPGVRKDQIDIQINRGKLTINVLNSNENAENDDEFCVLRRERTTEYKTRSLHFENIQEDAIEAEFENGLLIITLPKAEDERNKKINIK